MTKLTDDIEEPLLVGSAIKLNTSLSAARVGSVTAATAGLVDRVSPQLVMAKLNPVISPGLLAATRLTTSATIREVLKPIAAMQSTLAFIRPFTKLNEEFASYRSIAAELGGRGRYAQIAKQMSSVQPLLSTLTQANIRPLREVLGAVESLRGASRIAAELAAFSAAAQFSISLKSANLASVGAALVRAGQLPDAVEIDWEEPASEQLLSTLAAAAEALTDTVEDAPLLARQLSDLPDASNDCDGAFPATSQQLQSELANAASTGDLTKLSPAGKTYLKWFAWLILVLLNYIALQNAVREELCFVQPKIFPGMTAGQMGKAVRKALCEASVEIEGDFRLVKGVGVHLRASPTRKAEILPVGLPDGQIIEVLDSSNEDWLHVSVPSKGGVDGWIFRKYTRVLATH